MDIPPDQAFSSKALEYEHESKTNPIVRFTRRQVYRHVLSLKKPPATVLEINAGSGYDALNLAKMGYQVLATDSADGMVEMIHRKRHPNLKAQKMSFLNIQIDQKFDLILSNFGGLNTTPHLKKVFMQFPELINENGHAILTILNPLCIWELANLPWNRKTATRRFKWFQNRPTPANIDGIKIDTFYYSPHQIIKMVPKSLEMVKIQALSAIVPPSYMKHIPEKHPAIFNLTKRIERKISTIWPIYWLGDYFVISFQKTVS